MRCGITTLRPTLLAACCVALLLIAAIPASSPLATAATPADTAQGAAGGLALGSEHSCAIQAQTVLCWGKNDNGQLGDGSFTDRSTPAAVSGLTPPIRKVAAGGFFSCALSVAGAVYCWGDNSHGQLGDGTITDRVTPIPVAGLGPGVREIALGDMHACALVADGSVACWGRNDWGQLGDGTVVSRATPGRVAGLPPVLSVATGWGHTCVATDAGTVLCWGSNAYGQLGASTPDFRSTPAEVPLLTGSATVAAGDNFTCSLSNAGAVKCWGDNAFGQLGDGSTTSKASPTDVIGLASRVTWISAAGWHACAMMGEGVLKCWGWNQYGQLGDGSTANRVSPTKVPALVSTLIDLAVGDHHSCIRTLRGGVKCWGRNAYGQSGDPSLPVRPSPADILAFQPAPTRSNPRTVVRPILFVPSNLTPDPAYLPAIDEAVQTVSDWYANELDGRTFRYEPVRLMIGEHPVRHYCPKTIVETQCIQVRGTVGADSGDVFTVLDEVGRRGYPVIDNVVILLFWQGGYGYAGGARYSPTSGMAAQGDWALEGIADKYEDDTATGGCGDAPWGPLACTKELGLYTIAHELGHAFDLPHSTDDGRSPDDPNYWHRSIMTSGKGLSRAIFLDSPANPERSKLRRHYFFSALYEVYLPAMSR